MTLTDLSSGHMVPPALRPLCRPGQRAHLQLRSLLTFRNRCRSAHLAEGGRGPGSRLAGLPLPSRMGRELCSRASGSADTLPEPAAEAGDAPVWQRLEDRLAPVVLSRTEAAAVLVVPALACCLLYAALPLPALSLRLAAAFGGFYAALVTLAASLARERHYVGRLLEVEELGDEDSRFRRVDGIRVHYKVSRPPGGAPSRAVAMFHGFGANTFTWAAVDRGLSQRLHAQVTAHDMPGFGLTERPEELSRYTLPFNGRLGRALLEAELRVAGLTGSDEKPPGEASGATKELKKAEAGSPPLPPTDASAAADPESDSRRVSLSSSKGSSVESWDSRDEDLATGAAAAAAGEGRDGVERVLIGHSVGAVCAAVEAVERPAGITALVLVAPAIFAQSGTAADQPREAALGAAASDEPATSPGRRQTLRSRLGRAAGEAALVLRALGSEAAAAAARAALWVLRWPLILALRAAVRSKAFWENGLASAWHGPANISAATLEAYRQPQLVRGWERGLLRFVGARVASDPDIWRALRRRQSLRGIYPRRGLAARLQDTVQRRRLPVLIVHGTQDRLVPARNSRRLAKQLGPAARLVELDSCGHMPMEELPESFMAAVADFLGGIKSQG